MFSMLVLIVGLFFHFEFQVIVPSILYVYSECIQVLGFLLSLVFSVLGVTNMFVGNKRHRRLQRVNVHESISQLKDVTEGCLIYLLFTI